MSQDNLPIRQRRRVSALMAFSLITAALIAAGYFYFQAERRQLTQEKYDTLTGIAKLKAGEIGHWRRERLSEVSRAAGDSEVVEALADLLKSPGDKVIRGRLLEVLAGELSTVEHSEPIIYDPQAKVIAYSEEDPGPPEAETLEAIRGSLQSGGPVFSNFFRDKNGIVHIDLACPILGQDGKPLAVLVLRHEAGSYLFPLIQSWPVPSASAETELVQRIGDEMVYLNNLRFRTRSALNVRFPVTATNVPGVQAVTGRHGLFEGQDYRGVDVVSALMPIADSPWHIAAEIDRAEILQEAAYHAAAITLVVILCILLTGFCIVFIYRRRQSHIEKGLLKAERQRADALASARELTDRHRAILHAAMDGFWLVDKRGHIREVNPAYCRMSGYSEEELLTMHINDIDIEESPELTKTRIRKIIATGHDTFESRQRRKDGQIIDIEVSVHYQREEELMAAFIRDITERKKADEHLRRSERLLRESQETADIGTYSLGLEKGATWESSATLDKIFGITADYPKNEEGWAGLLHPDDRDHALSYFRAVLAERQPFRLDYRIVRPSDGKLRWVGAYGNYEFDDAGQPVRMIGCIQDITDRKVDEAKILRLSMLYSALSECNKAIVKSTSRADLLPEICRNIVVHGGMKLVWVAVVDSADGKILPAAAYGSGMDYLEDLEVSIDPASPLGRGPTGRCFREGVPVWCEDFQNDPITEPWHERGRHFGWASSASIPIRLRETTIGALTIYSERAGAFEEDVRRLLVEMGENVSFAFDHFAEEEERRNAEAELHILRTGIEQSENTIVITNAEGSIEYANPAFETSTGYTVSEAIGKNPRLLNPGTQDPEFYRDLWAQISSGRTWRGEFHNRRKDGTLFWESAIISPVRGESGTIEHFIAVKEDITERKTLENNLREALGRAEAANRAKSEFLAVMSHELRTPLNGVLGFSELLTDTGLDATQADYVKTIHESGSHLLAIVSDILDFSSIEKGTARLDSAPVSLKELIDGVSQTIRKSAGDKGLQYRSETESGLPDRFLGDGRRIRQILLNLLGNAVKFTAKGLISLRISRSSLDGAPALEFSISDTGPGIAEDVQARLFQPFTQGDSSLGRRYEGTGLGLAISKRLAEALGGKISVVSKPAYGSTFTVLLPLKEIAPPRAAPAPQGPPAAPPPEKRSGLILIVEDDRANRLLAGKMVESLGFRTVFAEDGSQAVTAFSSAENLTAILMDMQMPVMDGLEATRRIRGLEASSGSHVPIIALTANVMPADRARCMEAGMDDFLTKPFKKNLIAEKLNPDALSRMVAQQGRTPQNGQIHQETSS